MAEYSLCCDRAACDPGTRLHSDHASAAHANPDSNGYTDPIRHADSNNYLNESAAVRNGYPENGNGYSACERHHRRYNKYIYQNADQRAQPNYCRHRYKSEHLNGCRQQHIGKDQHPRSYRDQWCIKYTCQDCYQRAKQDQYGYSHTDGIERISERACECQNSNGYCYPITNRNQRAKQDPYIHANFDSVQYVNKYAEQDEYGCTNLHANEHGYYDAE